MKRQSYQSTTGGLWESGVPAYDITETYTELTAGGMGQDQQSLFETRTGCCGISNI